MCPEPMSKGNQLNSMYQLAKAVICYQYIRKGSMTRVPKWAYLMSAILIVMSVILAFAVVTAVFSLLGLHSLWEIDIQILLLYVIFPLSILIMLTVLTMAILLTRKRE
jgi:hypothetical protein